MQALGNHLLYELWAIMIAIYFLQGAVTGRLSKGGRGSREYWLLSGKGRIICLTTAFFLAGVSLYTGLLWFA